MDKKYDHDISFVLKELRNLHSAHEDSQKNQKELSEFVNLLREEIRVARDAEKTAEMKLNKCQAFVSQQQGIVLKLLTVKEENEQLKNTINQLQTTITDIQNNRMNDHVKKDAEVFEIKQEYLKELIKVQEATDSQVMKVRNELEPLIEDLKSTVTKNEEIINKKDTTIDSLKAELELFKQRSEVNIEIYQKKLADQERKYQAEIETWKMAELSRSSFDQAQKITAGQHTVNAVQPQYLPHPGPPPQPLYNYAVQTHPYQTKLFRQMQECSSHLMQNPVQPMVQTSYSTNVQQPQNIPACTQYNQNIQQNQNPPLVTRIRSVYPKVSEVNNVNPMSNNTTLNYSGNRGFQNANDVYLKNQEQPEDGDGDEKDDSVSENLKKKPPAKKPKAPVAARKRKLLNTTENFL